MFEVVKLSKVRLSALKYGLFIIILTSFILHCSNRETHFQENDSFNVYRNIKNFPAGALSYADWSYKSTGTIGSIVNKLAKVKKIESLFGSQIQKLNNWHRKDVGLWSAIWHSTIDGWQPLPGHGHQDFSGFELHYDTISVFIDLGRRSYELTGERDKHAQSHNTLTIDGLAPYPENRPYYSEEFRKKVTGSGPIWGGGLNHANVETHCFSRIKGIGVWRRSWKFTDKDVTISDTIDGKGRHKILRYLHTIHPVKTYNEGVIFGPFKVFSSGEPQIKKSKCWKSYGKGEDAMTIIFTDVVSLPSSLSLTVSFDKAS